MPDTTETRRDQEITAARAAARSTIRKLALDRGAQITTRPLYPGAQATTRDISPADGLPASHDLEQAARQITAGYIRQAREAGWTWHDIGTALHLTPDPAAGRTTAEAAFDYAATNPASHHARTYGRTAGWSCATCGNAISDHGPAGDERGHATSCQRLARTIRPRDTEREAGQ